MVHALDREIDYFQLLFGFCKFLNHFLYILEAKIKLTPFYTKFWVNIYA